jgi:hypothetical protein
MADGNTSVGFSGRQGFKRVNTTIYDEVRCLITVFSLDTADHPFQALKDDSLYKNNEPYLNE